MAHNYFPAINNAARNTAMLSFENLTNYKFSAKCSKSSVIELKKVT